MVLRKPLEPGQSNTVEQLIFQRDATPGQRSTMKGVSPVPMTKAQKDKSATLPLPITGG
jgi:hypothetical protein